MKPKNLKSPFSWKDRRVMVQDRVWYVPDYCDHYEAFVFPGWDSIDFFGNDHPVNIEYCAGNGTWIAEKALAEPNINWVAVEIQFKRVRKIWSKMKNRNLSNLLIICGEASLATRHYIPSESVNETFINFPDPWPKRRHAKHRIIAPPFLDELYRILKKEGKNTFVTDDKDSSERAIAEFGEHPHFESHLPPPYYRMEMEGYGTSFFEELWRSKGKEILYHQFIKR
jgi:tRNA (guanine-N7-)-methyltransferase